MHAVINDCSKNSQAILGWKNGRRQRRGHKSDGVAEQRGMEVPGEEKQKKRSPEGSRERGEAVAAAAVTSRFVFLITPDPGRAEEEELLSDVSIMTYLCTPRYV